MRKINPILRLQAWMDSVPGQTFLNYAYSWGAAIVILGALFKLTHIEGGNVMLFVGMGMEVIVFFLSAFDRPFDKTEIGKELPKHLPEDEEILKSAGTWEENEDEEYEDADTEVPVSTPTISTISTPVAAQPHAAAVAQPTQAPPEATPAPQVASTATAPTITDTTSAAVPSIEAEQLANLIRTANDELLRRAQAVLSPDMEAATQAYIDKMQALNDTLALVETQSRQMTRDNTEMENLNRALTGISVIYEHQLKSVSAQVGTIDRINEQTRRMADHIEELNNLYSRMIQALTVNIRAAAPTAPEAPTANP